MGILSDDFFDSWSDWKVELYSAISKFSMDPTEANHDDVVERLKDGMGNGVVLSQTCLSRSRALLAVCKYNRKRDALAICGPADDPNMVMTWKCSTHTPKNMRGVWKLRKFSQSRSGLYINNSQKFLDTHDVYWIPDEVYHALTQQFRLI